MQAQFVVEIERFRLSKQVWPGELSKRITVHLEGIYRNKTVRSAEYVVSAGTQVPLPWSTRLDRVFLRFYHIDDKLKAEVGFAEYDLAADKGFDYGGKPTHLLLYIVPRGGEAHIGKVQCSASVMYLYDEEDGRTAHRRPRESSQAAAAPAAPKARAADAELSKCSVPGFRFKRLSKIIDWRKIRSADVEQISSTNDVRLLRTFLNDVALGDAAMEDCDPLLLRALQLAQYSCQYVLASNKLLEEKKSVIKSTLQSFQEEDDILELKLAKLRAKKKALRREVAALDEIAESYVTALIGVNPKMARAAHNAYYRTRQSDADDHHHQEGRDRLTDDHRGERPRRRERHEHPPQDRASYREPTSPARPDRLWTRPRPVESSEQSIWASATADRASQRGREDPWRYSSQAQGREEVDDAPQQFSSSEDDLRRPGKAMDPAPGLLRRPAAEREARVEQEEKEEAEEAKPLADSRPPTSLPHRTSLRTIVVGSTQAATASTSRADAPPASVSTSSAAPIERMSRTAQSTAFTATATMSVDSLGATPAEPGFSLARTYPTHSSASTNSTDAGRGGAPSARKESGFATTTVPITRVSSLEETEPVYRRPVAKDDTLDSSIAEVELRESMHDESALADRTEDTQDTSHAEDSIDPMTGLSLLSAHDNNPRQPVVTVVDNEHSVVVDFAAVPSENVEREERPLLPPRISTIRFEDSSGPDSGVLSQNLRGGVFSPAVVSRASFGTAPFRPSSASSAGAEDGDDDMVLMGTSRFTPTATLDSAFEKDSLMDTGRSEDRPASQPATSVDYSEDAYADASFEAVEEAEGKRDDEELAPASTGVVSVDPASTQQTEESFIDQQLVNLAWATGKAPIELLELASALEVTVGAIGLQRKRLPSSVQEVYVTVEFLEARSAPSRTIKVDASDAIFPLSFSSHMTFDDSTCEVLREEIQELGESLTVNINVFDSKSGQLLGQAMIDVWNMIEHKCNILRNEVDIYTHDMTGTIGLLIVDVKGYLLMAKCS